jgi:signal transduction histidine kinase
MDISSNYLKYENTLIAFGVLLFVVVIFIIGSTNYFLTKSLLHRIVGPLEILNYGVHQIQLGNLDYRIEYGRKDEFSIVCADFNLMAQKLRESVDRQKKDEISRKELIAGISHDLRTPLTSIKAYVEGLIDEIATTPQAQKSYLQTIKTKAEDINQIVDKLFLFSKLDIGEFPFYPEKLMIGEELFEFVKATSDEYRNKGLILELTQNIKNVTFQIDPVQFRNVITNILENSVKYRNKDCGLMEIACFEREQNVCITLTDDGPGVPEEALDKIFDIFFRNDPSRNNPGKGSGLGLAISAKIIERSEGKIRAENVTTGGLRIVITIPKWGRDSDIH